MSVGSFYVTCMDADRRAVLLGPFETHSEALNNVDRGRDLACAVDERAWFYAYGTARSLANPPVLFSSEREAA